ncbi:hypothetical protein PM10SUCC1_32220 [Propionigenium maris DSM 9537]|uniref:DUF4376 domain-containing protein n=1 Tax=Propionigenium maris DSM 9537 TaxID=1123000 RepID=A0A9W6LPG0_9FUSO|nr:DUF4376 domain-containing protein [Propionigenium maris]GLI57708.1 hypothetical protein PM10SUCC1_32220 [Propionigenium maris DSM 9537]
MRVYKKKKMDPHYRYPSYIQLWKLLEEVREPVEVEEGVVEEKVTGYYYDTLELPHRIEFDQLREVDEEGNVIVEDYITENRESLLVEARGLELEAAKSKKELEITNHRDKVRAEHLVEWEGHKQRIRKEDTSDLDTIKTLAGINGNQYWFFSDKSVEQLTPGQITSLGDTMHIAVMELYRKEAAMKTEINSMLTVEEVQAYSIAELWGQI